MSRFEYFPQQALQPPVRVELHPLSSNPALSERDSNSPSDDGQSYLQYPDSCKHESDVDEDPNASLTSQSLNADGTPKRPMNAFMIFARRRRPQVSSENTSMRTGEISKILSREWNSMEAAEKQFYLDRAKELKEAFNSKYPDYVYRRRPNNSRRRRRTDLGFHLPPAGAHETGVGDGAEPLSVDVDDYPSSSGHRGHMGMDPSSYGPYGGGSEANPNANPFHSSRGSSSASSAASYPFGPHQHDPGFRQQHHQMGPVPFLQQQQQDMGQAHLRSNAHHQHQHHQQHPNYYQPYTLGHSHPGPADPNTGHSVWQSGGGRGDQGPGRGPPSAKALSLAAPNSAWPDATSPAVNGHTHGNAIVGPSSSPSQSFAFPTLNSPFYPNAAAAAQAHLQASYLDAPSSPISPSGSGSGVFDERGYHHQLNSASPMAYHSQPQQHPHARRHHHPPPPSPLSTSSPASPAMHSALPASITAAYGQPPGVQVQAQMSPLTSPDGAVFWSRG